MIKNLTSVLGALVVTSLLATSLTFAQNSGLGFFGDMSVKVYCTFSNFIPGTDNSACKTNILINDNGFGMDIITKNGSTSLTDTKISQINGLISRGFTTPKVIYQNGKNVAQKIILFIFLAMGY